MTDNEITKALEICTDKDNIFNCDKCVFVEYKMGHNGCYAEMLPAVLDLINRQKAEIESLQFSVQQLSGFLKNAKAKTIKEYKEKVKRKLLRKGFYFAILKNVLNDVEREMVGD